MMRHPSGRPLQTGPSPTIVMAFTPWISEHMATQRPQRTHLLGVTNNDRGQIDGVHFFLGRCRIICYAHQAGQRLKLTVAGPKAGFAVMVMDCQDLLHHCLLGCQNSGGTWCRSPCHW